MTGGRRLYWQVSITLAMLVAAVGMLAAHRATPNKGTDQLAAADGEWLLLACLAALATWVCAAVAHSRGLSSGRGTSRRRRRGPGARL